MPISLPSSKKTLYLVDISSFIFRAFYGIRPLSNRHGEPTHAVFGVATMLARLAEEAKPEYLAVIYDSKEPSFRKELYTEYKANRGAPPDALIPQFARIEQLIEAFDIHSYRLSGMEADDLIGTLTLRWCEADPENQVVIVTGDKDLMQLVSPRVIVLDTMANRTYGPSEVQEKLGVRPEQVRDYLSLVGDSSDNIPGVPGIGPKSATDLLKAYPSLLDILSAVDKDQISGKKAQLLRQYGKEARLSLDLATIRTDLPVEIPLTSLSYHFHTTARLLDLLDQLDFHSLIAKWSKGELESLSSKKALSETPSPVLPQATEINTDEEYQELLASIENAKSFVMHFQEHLGIWVSGKAYRLNESALTQLKSVFQSSSVEKIGYDLKAHWKILHRNSLSLQGPQFDVLLAGYLLGHEGVSSISILAAKFLNREAPKELSLEENLDLLVSLTNQLKAELNREDLLSVFETIEMPLVEVLADMETQGVSLDCAWLKTLSDEFQKELQLIEKKVEAYGTVNLNSPKQLSQLLFEKLGLPVQGKTKTGYSTDAQALAALSPLHEVPAMLLEYREISKLKGTYVDPLPLLVHEDTLRIHTTFHQTGTATGRLSSSDPNLQNIPIRSQRGLKIRRAFIPKESWCLLSADYSQIELRLLAHMSGDMTLKRAFLEDQDVHQMTASEIFTTPLPEVTTTQRSLAKAINFGLMYGKTAFGLSQELKIPRKEAQLFIDRYFERYHAVKAFLDQQILRAKTEGFVSTLSGRKRRLSDIQSKNPMLRSNAERMAMNSPIQGTAADLMKLAMIALYRELSGLQAKILIQVHDEVVLECPKDELKEVEERVIRSMEKAMDLSVPLKVNVAIGKNWMEL